MPRHIKTSDQKHMHGVHVCYAACDWSLKSIPTCTRMHMCVGTCDKHSFAAAIACIPFEFVCSDDQLAII